MEIRIELDEEILQKQVMEIVSKKLAEDILHRFSSENYHYNHKAIAEAVKEVVYSDKERLIEKCVDRASAELVRKGLVKLYSEVKTD